MKKWQVAKEEAGVKLLSFLKSKLDESHSARALKRAIESNLCLVNGLVERFASVELQNGEIVSFDETGIQNIPPRKFVLEKARILYEDDSCLVYNKPVGITSDKTGLAGLLKEYYLVHRLDRDTTGVIIFAKSKQAQNDLIRHFKNQKVQKTYLALVDGVPRKNSGIIDKPIGRLTQRGGQTIWGIVSPKYGKPAKTVWKSKKRGKNAALLVCYPKTGRTHQIRIHLKEIGCPILGDYQYTKKYHCEYHAKRCMLHAVEIAFPNLSTGKYVKIKAPVPKDFKQALRKIF